MTVGSKSTNTAWGFALAGLCVTRAKKYKRSKESETQVKKKTSTTRCNNDSEDEWERAKLQVYSFIAYHRRKCWRHRFLCQEKLRKEEDRLNTMLQAITRKETESIKDFRTTYGKGVHTYSSQHESRNRQCTGEIVSVDKIIHGTCYVIIIIQYNKLKLPTLAVQDIDFCEQLYFAFFFGDGTFQSVNQRKIHRKYVEILLLFSIQVNIWSVCQENSKIRIQQQNHACLTLAWHVNSSNEVDFKVTYTRLTCHLFLFVLMCWGCFVHKILTASSPIWFQVSVSKIKNTTVTCWDDSACVQGLCV